VVEAVVGDITSLSDVRAAMAGCDAVIHACSTHMSCRIHFPAECRVVPREIPTGLLQSVAVGKVFDR
jgi:hypothetical protein